MKKNKFLKTLLSSLMALSVVSTAAVPVSAEEVEAETEIGITEIAETEEEEEVIEIPEEEEDEEVEIGLGSSEEEEEETGLGFVGFKGTADEVAVTANAPEGAFPEGTEMATETVTDPAVIDMIKDAVGENAEVLAAVDITFTSEGETVQPDEAVKVAFAAAGITYSENLKVVHIHEEEAAEGDEPQLTATVLDPEAVTATEDGGVAFDADSFSIYAVVDTGTYARIKVNFKGLDNADIATIYVKKGDNMEQVLYDPGAGTLVDGVYFRGWTRDQNYTTDTVAKTIAQVRTEVSEMLPPAEDDTEVVYYAMLFKDYRITYLNEKDISLGQQELTFRADSTSAEQSYTVNMGYTVQDDTHHFEGWNVREGGTNIAGHTAGDIYQNNDVITITGDVTFGVNAPEGHWFIFDENGKGATYNAPQFVYSTAKPTRPNDANMTRNGYTFGGWFATKAEADATSDGTQYNFNQILTDKTTVYARWIPNTTANYTVLIWLENLDGTGYDFKEAVSLQGNVGSNVNTVVQQGSGNNAYARVNNVDKRYTGFHLEKFDQNVEIATEGNSVVNVYYVRTEYTLTFRINNSTVRTITEKYGRSIANYFPITNQNSGTKYDSYVWAPASGTQTYNQILVIIDAMPAESITFTGTDRGPGTTYATDNDFHNFKLQYYIQPDSLSTNHDDYELYNEVTAVYKKVTKAEEFITINGFDQETSVPAFSGNDINYNNAYVDYVYTVSTGDNDDNPAKYGDVNGQKQRVYWRTDGYGYWAQSGWSTTQYGSINWYTGTVYTRSEAMTVKFYYTRALFPITFLDGKYVDGDDKPITEAGMGRISIKEGIAYGTSIASYNSYEPDSEHTPSGYVFEGWFIDSECTQPYTFTTMPEGGVTVYAKWRQKQYRVFLHPNYPDGASGNIDWGSTNQALNFRISEGGHVSEPTGRLTGYEFVGWYLDEAYTQVFNGEAYAINESNVTTPYDKTVDMTDTYDTNGNLIDPKRNSDATGYNGGDRFWITKKLDIYAKWRSTLDGASGIVVEYDANGGSGAPSDNHTYVDGAKAPAGAASKASDDKKVFAYWVVQKWNGSAWEDTNVQVLPGDTFEVLAANAKIEDIANPQAGGDTKKYTVRLRAEYIKSEEPTPTHIYWYANDGSDAFHKDGNLKINEGVAIEEAPARKGYEFLGWARVDIGNTLDAATAWEANSANWTQNLKESDLYLHYKKDDGTFHLESTSGTAVTKVAADEKHPYHAMFAVWKCEITLVFSSDLTSKTYDVSDADFPTDLEALVTKHSSNHLYGGYYKYDGSINPGIYTAVDQQSYWGQSCFEVQTSSWNKLPKVNGSTYYIKEVPDWYLAPFLQYQYMVNYNYMVRMYLLTTVDDGYYREVGFARLNADEAGNYKYGHKTTDTSGNTVYDTSKLFELLPDNKPELYTSVAFASTILHDDTKDRSTIDAPYLIRRYDPDGNHPDTTNGYVVYKDMDDLHHEVPESESFYRVGGRSFSDLVFNYVAFFRTPDNKVVFGKMLRNVDTDMGDVDKLTTTNMPSSTYATSIGYITQQP